MKNDFNKFLGMVSSTSGVPRDRILSLAEQVAIQESGNKNVAQTTGGPGMGYFQMEPAYAKDAVKKLKNMYDTYGVDYPEWVSKFEKNPDPLKLDKEQQTMLFMGYNLKRDANKNIVGSTFSDLADENYDPAEWWAQYHKKVFKPAKENGKVVRTAEEERQRQLDRMRQEQGLGITEDVNRIQQRGYEMMPDVPQEDTPWYNPLLDWMKSFR